MQEGAAIFILSHRRDAEGAEIIKRNCVYASCGTVYWTRHSFCYLWLPLAAPFAGAIEWRCAMPYDTLSDLPDNVRDNLPRHAQEIYQAAFNNAWDEYHHDEARAH